MTHIVVLGAGYTGMIAALGVAHRNRTADVQVTLINPSERFTERLRMHQRAAGQELKNIEIPALLRGTQIKFVKGWATKIDAEARTVTVDGAEIAYDKLVFAIGSVPDTSVVPGASEHAYTLDTLPRGAVYGTLVVCGGGLTGVETATELAESYPDTRIILVSRGEPAAMMGKAARAHMFKAFDRLGVEVRSGVSITKVLSNGIELDGEFLPCDGAIWTTGVRVPVLAASVQTDASGRIVVDSALRSVSHPSIYAVGDAAAVTQPFGVMHGTCQGGIPTAGHAAESITRELKGLEPKPFRFGYFHQPVSLGRRDAVIQFTNADDTPRRWLLRGWLAVQYKEMVSSSPLPTFRLSRWLTIPAGMLALSKGPRR